MNQSNLSTCKYALIGISMAIVGFDLFKCQKIFATYFSKYYKSINNISIIRDKIDKIKFKLKIR